MAAPGKKFSWKRLISNAIPNFANDSKHDLNLTPLQASNLLSHQLAQPLPYYLSPLAFQITNLVTASQSNKIHTNLVKHKILLPIPSSPSPSEKIAVNTNAITKDFANQHATISIHVQRQVVSLLFFWEEECVRWRLLDQEEEAILKAMEEEEGMSGGARMDLGIALRAVRMKRCLPPGERGEGTANVTAGRGSELPGYEGVPS
ncbi:hypothetical protein BJ875DRAFT_448683 [Amylocarpus encephaloides]|uniref:Uncharacterized protein n=1 Tax=Amylocarpus encephaloides TaxID=45428 RepID=A0A9P8CBH8_9HELO|nr:hypothetical protein BJ875DRAFT_448683 [Amylocarpus encephaloides]